MIAIHHRRSRKQFRRTLFVPGSVRYLVNGGLVNSLILIGGNMAIDLGDRLEDSVLDFKFHTTNVAGLPFTLAGSPALAVYKSNSVVQTTAGITLSVDFDSLTGAHHVRIDTSADAFYATDEDYEVVLTAGTVDNVPVAGYVVATFSIENRFTRADMLRISGDLTAADNLEAWFDGTGYAAANSTIGTCTTNTDMISSATVNAACDSAIETYGLDHLVSVSVAGTDVTDNSIIARMVSSNATADWDTFNHTTDSLESIRNRGDSDWSTATSTQPDLLVNTTIATLASQTSFTLTTGSADDDAYNGAMCVVVDSATSTQVAKGRVSDYTGSTKTITLAADPAIFTMAVGDTVRIIAVPDQLDAAATQASVDALNNISTSDVTTSCTTSLNSYDAPTKAEMDSAFAALNDPSAAAIRTEMDSNSTQLAAIVADTNELQTNWASPSGSLYTLLSSASDPQVLQSTTIASLSTQTSFTLTAGSADNDAYNGALIVITDSSTSTQKAYGRISDYVGSTRTVTLASDPGIFTMANGDSVDIIAVSSQIAEIDSDLTVLKGDWDNGGRLDLILDARASQASVDALNDLAGSDIQTQCANALNAYDGPTKTEMDTGFANLNDLSSAQVQSACSSALTAANIVDTSDLPTNFSDLSITATTGRVDVALIEGSDATDQINAACDTAMTDYGANTTTPPTTSAIADAVLDELVTGHVTANSLSKVIQDINTAIAALNDVSTTDVQNSCASALTAGNIVDTSDLPTNFGDLSITATSGRVDVASIEGTDASNVINAEADQALTDYGANTTTPPTAAAVATEVLTSSNGVETGITLKQALRVILAAASGESSGHDTNTPVFKDPSGTTNRISASTDADGNRSSVTLNTADV